MRTRDPEAKRQQLFGAALAEFAEFGMAGARIDRLAGRAGISPGLVYSFYAGKAELFDAVFDHIVGLTISTVPIDADHLPQYAARLHDAAADHPEAVRFLTWYQLERGEAAHRATVTVAMREKVAAIKGAQQRGTVTSAIPAPQILALVLTIAGMWNQSSEDLLSLVPAGKRRKVIIEAVARLTAP